MRNRYFAPIGYHFCLAACFIVLLIPSSTVGQRGSRLQDRLEEQRLATWPPEQVYLRTSLGHALQRVFRKHFDFCGFNTGPERRDFIPPDISRFLGRRSLRTKVESADISGGSLLQYVFHHDEIGQPLDILRYSPSRLLQPVGPAAVFEVNPETSFDAFVLTKNCSGYLKSSLDAGIEPPYAAFKTALTTDERRESSVVALSGAFVSPLRAILRARDARTTELMLQLWQFYQQYPTYAGRAYYLSEFEGVMIKHLGSAEETQRVENEIGLNVNAPLGAHLRANMGVGRTRGGSFTGADWETIVFADFTDGYQRGQWFAPLPTPSEIAAYFASLRPVFQKPRDFPLLSEGAEHRHYLIVEGLPEALCRQPWVLELQSPGVYAEPPRVETAFYREADGSSGGRFTVTGRPNPGLFVAPLSERPGQVDLAYTLRSAEPVGGAYLRLHISEALPTSAHPVARLGEGKFDLRLRENRRFAFQWRCVLEIDDQENPVDFGALPYLSNLQMRRSDQTVLDVEVSQITADAARHQYIITLESRETWPLERIDDRQLLNYNLTMEVHLPSQRAPVRLMRVVRSIVAFPQIRPDTPTISVEALQALPLPPTTTGGGGGSGEH